MPCELQCTVFNMKTKINRILRNECLAYSILKKSKQKPSCDVVGFLSHYDALHCTELNVGHFDRLELKLRSS